MLYPPFAVAYLVAPCLFRQQSPRNWRGWPIMLRKSESAKRLMSSCQHRTWGFQLLHDVPLGNLYVEKIAERLLQAALLPAAEANDAQILAESAAVGCSM